MSFHLGKPILVMLVLSILSMAAILAQREREPADLTVWTFADAHYKTFEPLIAEFEREHGVRVNLQLVQNRAMNIRLEQGFSTGGGTALPDLVEVEIGSVGRFFRPPLEDVGFEDLTGKLKESGWYDRIVKARFAPWSKEGRIFGVPHDVHPVTITYRRDLFEEAGIDLNAPRTWPELHRALMDFKRYWRGRGHTRRHPIELPAATSDYLTVMLLQRGINLVDDYGNIHLNDPRVAETVAFYAGMVAGPGNVASESTGGQGSFAKDLQEGNICAFVTPDWRVTYVRRYGTNVDDPSRDLTGKMAMRPLPVFDETDAPTGTWGGTMIAIPKASKKKELAWELLEYLYFSREGLEARRKLSDILPPIPEYWADAHYHQPDPFFGGQRSAELFTELAGQIPPRYVTPATGIAQSTLSFVLYKAVSYVEEKGTTEGLEARVQAWLDEAAADLRARIEHWRFEEESARAE